MGKVGSAEAAGHGWRRRWPEMDHKAAIEGMTDREILDYIFAVSGFEKVTICEFNRVELIQGRSE